MAVEPDADVRERQFDELLEARTRRCIRHGIGCKGSTCR